MAQNLVLNILAKDKTKQAFNGVRAGLTNLRSAVFSVQSAIVCLLYTSPSPRDVEESRMPSSA